MTQHECHDCGCQEGAIHDLGCDMELCPWCGGQLINCDCIYEQLGISCDSDAEIPELTDAQYKKWLKSLNKKGRIPYILYPIICPRCGKKWPEMFHVPDEEWNKYIFNPHDPRSGPGNGGGGWLCWECYDEIRVLIDGKGKKKRAPLELGYDDSHYPGHYRPAAS